MIIPLGNKVRAEVVDSVLGQLSDGIWENSGAMDKYWKFANVDGTDLDISDESSDSEIQYGYNFRGRYKTIWNGFHGKSEAEIKNWFANKAKQVVKIWAEDYNKNPNDVWNRNNTDVVDYMGSHVVPEITVADVYECYDFLKGRSGKQYGAKPVEEPVEDEPYEVLDDVIEPDVSGGMNPSQHEVEDFFLDASTNIRCGTKYPKGYVAASDSYDIGEAAQHQRLKRKEAAKRKGNKELLDQYALLVGTRSNDNQAIEVIYDEILSRMNKNQVNASKKISRKEVYEYLDELGGYVGYDDKIDALVEDLGISREDAEGYVWNHASGLDRLNGQR